METTPTQTPNVPSEPAEIRPVVAEYIGVRPGYCGGHPHILGHRIKVKHVAIWYEKMGMMPVEIVQTYPTITLSQVHAALAYYYDHREEIEASVREEDEFVEKFKAENPSLLAEKLEERRAKNPLLGMMADEPELMDDIAQSAMRDRETRPLRLLRDG